MTASVWLLSCALMALSALAARTMIAVGIMDLPDARKLHARPMPRAGGVGPMLAVLAGIAVFPVLWDTWIAAMLAAAAALGLFGLADDCRNRGAAAKLAAQSLAAVCVVGSMASATPGWSPPALLLAWGWLVFITNVFNFMDGLDGLAGGSGMLAAAILAALAPVGGPTQAVAVAMAAGLAGFLPFNLPQARLFLGDTGSQFCGFLLGLLGLQFMAESAALTAVWLQPCLLSGMILDVVLTLARRAGAGARLTAAHRDHFYQRAKLPAGVVAAVHWGFVALGAWFWLLLSQDRFWPAVVPVLLAHPAWLGYGLTGDIRIRA